MNKQNLIYEIKDCIDSLYGSDCAYYGVDGIAIATVLAEQGYRKEEDVAREIFAKIQLEISEALENNRRMRATLIKKYPGNYGLVFMESINAKYNCLRGIDDFIEELKKKYGVEK